PLHQHGPAQLSRPDHHQAHLRGGPPGTPRPAARGRDTGRVTQPRDDGGVTVRAEPAVTSRVLTRDEWLARRSAHHDRVGAWLGIHLDRRRHGAAHPVEDFPFGKVKITNALPYRRLDQQQWPGQGSKYRAWSRA